MGDGWLDGGIVGFVLFCFVGCEDIVVGVSVGLVVGVVGSGYVGGYIILFFLR